MFWTSNMRHPLACVLAVTAIFVLNLGKSLLAFPWNKRFEWLCWAYLSVFKKKIHFFICFFFFFLFSPLLGTDLVIGECIDLYIYSRGHFIHSQSPLDQEWLKDWNWGLNIFNLMKILWIGVSVSWSIYIGAREGWVGEMHWWLLIVIACWNRDDNVVSVSRKFFFFPFGLQSPQR